MGDRYPKIKDIIFLIGIGTIISASVLFPGLGYIAKEINKYNNSLSKRKSRIEWDRFNLKMLKRNLKRLKEQKVVEVINRGEEEIIKLTDKGKIKFLKFKMDEISSKNPKWDGKWRVIIYDINKFKKIEQSAFRKMLKNIRCLKLQKSVYITPYQIEENIEFLREYFGISDEVIYLRADKIENEEIYKHYFGL